MNVGELNLFKGFIPLISGDKGVWYLKRKYFGVDFIVLVFDLTEIMVFVVTAALAISFTIKSPSFWPRLALRVLQRSTPEVVQLYNTFCLPDATILL